MHAVTQCHVARTVPREVAHTVTQCDIANSDNVTRTATQYDAHTVECHVALTVTQSDVAHTAAQYYVAPK